MRKTYQMFVALMLCMLGTTTANAEEISLDEVPFWQHEVWGLDEPKNNNAEFAWVIGEATDLPYGDTSVINFADLSAFTKLVVTLAEGTEGTPRFLFNRDMDEGQWNATESESHLIDNTRGGWCSKYFTQDGNVFTVDVKQLVKDKGYAHLHAIKSGAWGTTITVESMVVVSAGKAKQIGWVNLINNSNMEGDDNSSFFTKVDRGNPLNSEITDGIGVDGSRGIMVAATDKVADPWDNQFWFRFNEPVNAGAKYRVSFDYRADTPAKVSTQAHAEPSDYIHWQMFGDVNFALDWQTFTAEGEISADQSKDGQKLLSVAFNLNEMAEANNYYFDNIKFEIYKVGTSASFCEDAILIDFGFDTNIADMIPAGTKRVFIDNSCATVKVNGKAAEIYSIEGLEDGRLYIFLNEAADPRDEVAVTLTNNFGLKYTSGMNIGEQVPDFADIAEYSYAVSEADGAYPYDFVTPTLIAADPEDGSFNLPLSISEFKLKFDKNVDCAALKATLEDKALTVTPATGFASELVLKREGADLAPGKYTLHAYYIYPELRLDDSIYGDTTFVFSIGPSDPTDIPYDVIPVSYFNDCPDNSVPEGFILYADGETPEQRTPGNNYGSGNRMFSFGAGGDFTKGLYMRTWYLSYGEIEDHPLTLEAGKSYNLTFNAAIWNERGHSGNTFVKAQVLDSEENVVFEQVMKAAPILSESKNAVSNSARFNGIVAIEKDGNYVLKLIAATNENGDPADNNWYDLILANVKLNYVPATAGGIEMAAVADALAKAKTVRDGATDERYDGAAFDALNAAIEKVEAEKSSYTSPSACYGAVDLLTSTSEALNNHVVLCNDYDAQVKKAIDVQRQNEMPDGDPAKATKFTRTELFAQLKAILAKYNASSQWVDNAEPGTVDEEGNEVHDWKLVYTFDVLKDDALLADAAKELKDIADVTSKLFTIGVSAPENANGGKGTGVAVLVDRLRLGAETLKSLGVPETDSAIVAANDALTDDDALAEWLKMRIKQVVYGELKNADNTLFAEQIDEVTFESTTPTYDMTVFVKNPNTYKLSDGVDFTDESVPGWVTPEDYNRPGLTPGWGAWQGTSEIAQDAMFQTWGSSYRVEQTIEDLPAGVYTIKYGFGERNSDVESNFEDSYTYAITSDGVEFQGSCAGIGQSFPFANADNTADDTIEGVEVIDGILTIGVNAGPSSHTFFNEVRVIMTAPAIGFDYGTAYTEGIDENVAEPKVRAIELFDLNGRRVMVARKGVAIVKKHMADGTTRTEKVVVK